MQKFKLIAIIISLSSLMISAGLNAQEVSLDIVESAGGCGLASDCPGNLICFDIRMTVDVDKALDSYNIWMQYDNTVLSRVNGGSDASCVLADGGDTDIEASSGAYRVAGIPGAPFPMSAGVQETVHTICFSVLNAAALEGTIILVGGNLFGGALPTSITFNDATSDDVPEETPLVLSEATVSCLEQLPVDLLSFEAEKRGGSVELFWETANEYNNSHFEIERSIDQSRFSQITKVESKGNSATHQSYFTKDLSPAIGDNFYRLKQVDFDGQYSYSEIRTVRFTGEGRASQGLEVYPNPTTDMAHITFEQVGDNATINVLNALGEFMKSYRIDENRSGLTSKMIRMSDYPEGTYLIQLLQGDKVEMSQVVKID